MNSLKKHGSLNENFQKMIKITIVLRKFEFLMYLCHLNFFFNLNKEFTHFISTSGELCLGSLDC